MLFACEKRHTTVIRPKFTNEIPAVIDASVQYHPSTSLRVTALNNDKFGHGKIYGEAFVSSKPDSLKGS